MQTDLTIGSVLKNIALFSLPYFLSYFLQTLYGLADLFIIGQFEGGGQFMGISVLANLLEILYTDWDK